MNEYIFRINANFGRFAAVIFANAGMESQTENPIPINQIEDDDTHEFTYLGENIIVEFAHHQGEKNLVVQVLKNGEDVETKQCSEGNSLHFNIDIE